MKRTHQILKRFITLLSDPETFFKHLKSEHGVSTAFFYLNGMAVVSLILGAITSFIVGNFFTDWLSSIVNVPLLGLSATDPNGLLVVIGLVAIFIMQMLASFVVAGVLHVWVLLFGGKARYAKSYQLYVYAKAPQLLFSWIPVVGIIAWIYSLILLIIGTQQVHGIKKGTSILMFLIPFAVVLVLALVFVALAVAIIISNPTF